MTYQQTCLFLVCRRKDERPEILASGPTQNEDGFCPDPEKPQKSTFDLPDISPDFSTARSPFFRDNFETKGDSLPGPHVWPSECRRARLADTKSERFLIGPPIARAHATQGGDTMSPPKGALPRFHHSTCQPNNLSTDVKIKGQRGNYNTQ